MVTKRMELTSSTRPSELLKETAQRPGELVLRVHDGPSAGREFRVTKPLVQVGRSQYADITIDHPSISKLHFELKLAADGVELRDLGSRNGVWFAKRRVFHCGIGPGDVFQAGECTLQLVEVGKVSVEASRTSRYGELFGSSLVMRELYVLLERLAPTPLDILILGETGTGKELTARTIHKFSGRAQGPFIVLDCGSLPHTLAESILFGYRRGTFTGAEQDTPGIFEQADGGTIFLDEIGDLPLDLQVKLLRVLDRREVSRLGESSTTRPLSVRVIAATHRDLRHGVTEGRFREDLYYRLARALVTLPPLRDRGNDVLELAETFLQRVCEESGLDVVLGGDTKLALVAESWPGNVRELHNVISQAAYLRQQGVIEPTDLQIGADRAMLRRMGAAIEDAKTYESIHNGIDAILLPQVMTECGGNVTAAAKRLGISRETLRGRLKEMGWARS